MAHATELPRPQHKPSSELQALIESHLTTYATFGKVVHEVSGKDRDYDNANREEERALLAICGYPAATQGDRLTKARHLLEVEARGELDLPRQMQTLLRSMMWKG